MTLLANLVRTPAARALGWTLFHFLWEGLAIAVALAAALLVLRSARLRYTAACLALAAMLAVCVATFLRVLPEQASHAAATALLAPRVPAVDGSGAIASPRLQASDLLPWAAPLWLAGVLLLHLRTMAGWIAARRLRRSGVCPATRLWQERLAALAAGVRLSTPVALLESCLVDVPLVVGYLRPVILMPLGLLAGMPPDQLEAILLHELGHILRRDYLVNLLQALAENLLFYHPAVWWVSNLIRAEREHCCDDLVVAVRGNARDYAIALTALEEKRWTGEPALAATGGNLVKRIHRLLGRPQPPHAALTPAFSAGLIVVTAAIALAAWQPKPDERPQESAAQTARVEVSPYHRWLNEDVVYIITKSERDAFQQLATDPEREHFIEQFWLRRDPTPGTPANEFKEEYYRRIAYANQRYAMGTGTAGWRTDRGRVYITYGPPDEIESHPDGDKKVPHPYEQWLYHYIESVGSNVIIEFDDATRTGNYRMIADPNAADAVSREAIWTDTVKRGDMRRQVRGLGSLGAGGAAEIKIAETQMKEIKLGLTATVDFRGPLASGRVARIDPTAVNGTINVTIQLDAPPPAAVQEGQQVDAAIEIEILKDVLYVGRPVLGKQNSDAVLFKIEPDGQHAVQAPVRFGRTSVNQIEVVGGLAPGDRVIVSDMTAYSRFNRIQLR